MRDWISAILSAILLAPLVIIGFIFLLISIPYMLANLVKGNSLFFTPGFSEKDEYVQVVEILVSMQNTIDTQVSDYNSLLLNELQSSDRTIKRYLNILATGRPFFGNSFDTSMHYYAYLTKEEILELANACKSGLVSIREKDAEEFLKAFCDSIISIAKEGKALFLSTF